MQQKNFLGRTQEAKIAVALALAVIKYLIEHFVRWRPINTLAVAGSRRWKLGLSWAGTLLRSQRIIKPSTGMNYDTYN